METIGEEADGQEFDFEIDLSSFRNGGESSEFVSSGTKDPQHVQPKLPNREGTCAKIAAFKMFLGCGTLFYSSETLLLFAYLGLLH